ncbi:peptidoglycan DD-metalloendopeptidase family protein [Pseudoglutamicibacter cumminsii]|uniref:peptidoglycan DD-metalloendopeptidase family protein n=1 Tax=Pseudoglutamicibacter cumminsii TaxID=156979 RepID=UPI0019575D62|nr:tape measure domain-containing protein [Pseudoglutamicibacter cumminsii]
MAYTERIQGELLLDVSDWMRGMAEAQKATEETSRKSREHSRKQREQADETAKAHARQAKSAKAVSSVLSGVGTAFAGATTAAGAMATKLVKQGVAYNTLQASSRAALTTIFKDAGKANTQMDKLDAFAKNSPFAKDVFIKAQQQLLGFGLEADKVIPTLGAVQDAVAAVGGTNEDIAGITEALAKMKGQGKLSAQELNQLGQYGIDAAAIIGEEMGLTSQQIRAMASKPGGIPAEEIWDPLTKGLTKRFGGAAASVKETWVGATDRIKAAWRDTGSVLAKPLIDPKGGGQAILWANQFADVLRGVEKQAGPLTDMLVQRLTPGMIGVSKAMEDARVAVNNFDIRDLNSMLSKLAGYGPAIAGVSAALFSMGTKNIPIIGSLTGALGPLPTLLLGAAAASPEMRDAFADLIDAAGPLIKAAGEIGAVFAGTLSEGMAIAGKALQGVAGILGAATDAFDKLPGPVKSAALALAGLMAVRKFFPVFAKDMAELPNKAGGAVQGVVRSFSGWTGTFRTAAAEAGTFGGKVTAVGKTLAASGGRGFLGAVNGIMGALGGPWGLALTGATLALGYLAKQNADAKARLDELRGAVDAQTGALTENAEAVAAKYVQEEIGTEKLAQYGVSLADATQAVLGQGDAQERVAQQISDSTDEAQRSKNIWETIGDAIFDPFNQGASQAALEAENLQGQISKGADTLADAAEKGKANADAVRELEAAQTQAHRAAETFTQQIKTFNDETRTAAERTDAFANALDLLRGDTASTEEMNRKLAASQRSIGQFFQENAEKGEAWRRKLVDVKTGTIQQSDEGDRLNQVLSDHRKKMLDATRAAYDKAVQDGDSAGAADKARAAYARQTEELKNTLREAGLTEEQIRKLTRRYLDTPDAVETTIKLMGKKDFEADAKWLTRQRDMDVIARATADWNSFERVLAKAQGYMTKAGKVVTPNSGKGFGVLRADGGRIPGYAAGGRPGGYKLPTTGPGTRVTDGIVGVTRAGVPLARLDAGEWVIRRKMADKYDALLAGINADAPWVQGLLAGYARGGRPGVGVKVSPPQVEGVDAPDKRPLTDTWETAMEELTQTTTRAFTAITTTTAQQGKSQTKTVQDQGRAQQTAVKTSTARMLGDTKAAFTGMRAVASTQAQGMRATVTTHTQGMSDSVAAHTKSMRQTASTQAQSMRTTVVGHALGMRNTVTSHADGMRGSVASHATSMRSSAVTEFNTMRDKGVSAAGSLRTGMVEQMSAAQPGFTGAVNRLVGVLQRFSSSVNKAYGDYSVKLGSPVKLATGGIMPGYTPGRDVHKFMSPTGGALELSGGEAILRPEATRALGAGWVHSVNAAARKGGSAGVRSMLGTDDPNITQRFADGGIFQSPAQVRARGRSIAGTHKGEAGAGWFGQLGRSIIDKVTAAAVKRAIKDLEEFAPGRGFIKPTIGSVTAPYGQARGRYPHAGIDFAAPGGGPTWASAAGRVMKTGWNILTGRTGIGIALDHGGGYYTYYGHNPPGGVKVKPGDKVRQRDRIGAQGNTGNSTGTHLHFEIHKGRYGAAVNPAPYLAGDKAPLLGGVAGVAGGAARWASDVRRALAANGLPTTSDYVGAWLRQIQTESGGNPRARQGIVDINSIMGMPAQGLLQTIPPTFNAFKHKGHGDIYNGYDNMLAAMAYAKSRYGVKGMLQAVGRGRGYASGGPVTGKGTGTSDSILARLSHGEHVWTAGEVRAAGGHDVVTALRALATTRTTTADIPARVQTVSLSRGTLEQIATMVDKAARAQVEISGPVTTVDPAEIGRAVVREQTRRARLATL